MDFNIGGVNVMCERFWLYAYTAFSDLSARLDCMHHTAFQNCLKKQFQIGGRWRFGVRPRIRFGIWSRFGHHTLHGDSLISLWQLELMKPPTLSLFMKKAVQTVSVLIIASSSMHSNFTSPCLQCYCQAHYSSVRSCFETVSAPPVLPA